MGADKRFIGHRMKPGIYPNLPIQKYHASDGYSKTQLWTLESKSTYHFWHEYIRPNKQKPDLTKWGQTKRGMCIGGATAALMDSEDVFKAGYYVLDDETSKASKNSKVFKDTFAAAVTGYPLVTVILAQEYEQAKAIAEAVHEHPDPWTREQLAGLFSAGNLCAEYSYYWLDEETGLLIKTRPDLGIRKALLADVKTTQDCGPWQFSKQILTMGHHIQAAMGLDIVNKVDKCAIDNWLLIVVEQSPPHDVAAYYLGKDSLMLGYKQYRAALRRLRDCLREDKWPGKMSGLQEIDVPNYALNEGLNERHHRIDNHGAQAH